MRRFIIVGGLLFLVGCSKGLDTSQLSEKKVSENGFIKSYEAPTVEVAIDALPYKVNLPERFPFETEGFQSLGIRDMSGKGENVEAEFMALGDSENHLYVLTTLANIDYPEDQSEKLTLDNGYQAFFHTPNHLDVVVKDVTYLYTLTMLELEKEQVKKELLKLAEQLSE